MPQECAAVSRRVTDAHGPVQAFEEGCQSFDYMTYAERRIGQYYELKGAQ